MADPLEETISLSDMTEITETEDPRATQQRVRVVAAGVSYLTIVDVMFVLVTVHSVDCRQVQSLSSSGYCT